MAHPLEKVVQHIRQVAARQGATDGELLLAFLTADDQAAFAALVKRHGPLVFAVCKRVLGNVEDAEDSFQAVFVVLARNAAKLPRRCSLSTWLHGVAFKIALNARRLASRRRRHERQAQTMVSTNPASDASWREVQLLLDEEIHRLPERYRDPFILCCLEGQSYATAGQRLGLKESTVHGRLTEARKRLQVRLSRRGVELTAVLGAAALSPIAATAQVAPALVAKAVSAATSPAVPASVMALVKGLTVSLAIKKAKVGMALFLVFSGLVGTTSMWAVQQEPAGKEKSPVAKAAGKQEAAVIAEPAVLKDIYGDLLPPGAVARIGTVRFRHPDHISFLAMAPEGDFIISQASDGVRVWDTKAGKELRHFPHLVGHSSTACDLSPDGKLIATQDKKADSFALWDIESGRQVHNLGVVRNLARFSPDGKYLLTDGSDGNTMAKLWDVATGKAIRAWSPHERFLFSATFTRDSKTLITALSGQVRCWDVATGMKTREFSTGSKSVSNIVVSPDGKLLATVGTIVTGEGNNSFSTGPENSVRIWDIALGKELRRIDGPDNKGSVLPANIGDFRFAPDGKSIITCGMDSALRIWDVATGKESRHIPLDCYASWHLAFSRDGNLLATAAAKLTIRLFDLSSGKDLAPPGEHQMPVGSLAFFARGQNLASVSGKCINVWNPATGRLRYQMSGPKQTITQICLAGDGRTLFSASQDKGIYVWDVETGKKLRDFPNMSLSGWPSLALAPDGKTMALTNGKSVEVLDAETGRKIQEFTGHEFWARSVAFVDGGKKLMVWSADDKLYVWDLASGRQSLTLPIPMDHGPLRQIAITPDSRLIALAGRKKDLVVIDLATTKELAYAANLPDAPCVGAFSPDGRTLAWAGWTESPVRLMEIASGKERRHFLGHKGRVVQLAYSADGGMLASGGLDTTALVWDLIGKDAKETPPLTDHSIRTCWDALASEDAGRAFNAIRTLAADPTRAIPFFEMRLQPVPNVDEKDMAKLITDLGSDVFAVREDAARRLEKLGDVAELACRKTLETPTTLEVRRRLESLLEKHKQQSRNPEPDFIRSLRALETLELAGTLKAREVLTKMSTGASQARLSIDAVAALERLRKRN